MIFGSPNVFRLRKEPKFTLVSTFGRTAGRSGPTALTVQYFLHEVVSPYDLDDHQRFFGSPRWRAEPINSHLYVRPCVRVFVRLSENFANFWYRNLSYGLLLEN